jgi:hypothetical protein
MGNNMAEVEDDSLTQDKHTIVLCSECFRDQGLKLMAQRLDDHVEEFVLRTCPNCGATNGTKITRREANQLAHDFLVWGSYARADYGAAPVIQINSGHRRDVKGVGALEHDLALIEERLNLRAFHYGPRLWMVGEIEPLKELQDPGTRQTVLDRILSEYPSKTFHSGRKFYRIRKNPLRPESADEYDSCPVEVAGSGRLDSTSAPVMYGSEDLQICFHECRVSSEDELFVATLSPKRDLNLLDVSTILKDDEFTSEFESLDLAVHMLFLAGSHSYPIARSIAIAAQEAGFDGLVYPSYFSLLKVGIMPFQTSFGISHRRFAPYAAVEQAKITPNLALFGRPIEQGLVSVECINRAFLASVTYDFGFGPVGYS